jgi:putative hydrolase of the HAD superfamily
VEFTKPAAARWAKRWKNRRFFALGSWPDKLRRVSGWVADVLGRFPLVIQAILFDLGDTLLDFEPLDIKSILEKGAADSYKRLVESGVKLPSLKRYRKGHVRAVKLGLLWSRLIRRELNVYTMMRQRTVRLGVPDADALMLDLGWRWYRPVVAYSRIESNLIPTLKMFRSAGIKMGIVSNTFIGGPLLDLHLKEMGILEFFPIRIYSSEVGYRKPHKEIYRIALAEIDTPAQNVLFVGDVLKNDVIGPKKMGMQTALKQRWSVAREHDVADHLIRQISDLIPVVLPEVAGIARTRMASAAQIN